MPRFRSLNDDDGSEATVDISPLIDCVFILLIFFIVTTTFVNEEGITIDKPEAASASDDDGESIMLGITEEGQIVHEGASIGIAGVRPLVRRELAKGEQVPVIIRADRAAASGMLVAVIDAAKLAGAEKVSVAQAQ
jgi:biopolymer transport protein ExbD